MQALESGTDLADVPGLCVSARRQAGLHRAPAVVGFDVLPDVPWHLLDFEKYVALQNDKSHGWKVRHKYADPWDMPAGTPLRGFSYFSSFGCPEPCTFCCSPLGHGPALEGDPRRSSWPSACSSATSASRSTSCASRTRTSACRRSAPSEFCEALVAAGSPFWWNGTFEIETIARYKEETLDLLAKSRFHMAASGRRGRQPGAAEEDQEEHPARARPREGARAPALARHAGRLSWIIGYPGESLESMRATLRMAAEVKHRFPNSPSDIFPFRPIPGTEDFDSAVKLGYQPPRTLEQWGSSLEYKFAYDDIGLPWEIIQTWKRYGVASTFYDSLAQEGAGPVRSLMHAHLGLAAEEQQLHLPARAEAVPRLRAPLRPPHAGQPCAPRHHLGRDAARALGLRMPART